ncbi:PA14 domain-containing protein, partial [Salmonella sp. SAL4444]|uniref:PA14 domain-containing protein n=1 Tax=Salmonella sp. SAL4444 TaxID=3159899 RepID=UPI00397C0A40
MGSSGLGTGPWTAQYYANPTLSGSPTLIQTESSPTHDWGTGSPVVSIPPDNFSARWTSTRTVEAGTYQISVRVDDGVRVFV